MRNKLTNEDRKSIYIFSKLGFKQAELANKYGVSIATISKTVSKFEKMMQTCWQIDKDIQVARDKMKAMLEQFWKDGE